MSASLSADGPSIPLEGQTPQPLVPDSDYTNISQLVSRLTSLELTNAGLQDLYHSAKAQADQHRARADVYADDIERLIADKVAAMSLCTALQAQREMDIVVAVDQTPLSPHDANKLRNALDRLQTYEAHAAGDEQTVMANYARLMQHLNETQEEEKKAGAALKIAFEDARQAQKKARTI
jgi:hypothetical protein